jgi:hypothetical protein
MSTVAVATKKFQIGTAALAVAAAATLTPVVAQAAPGLGAAAAGAVSSVVVNATPTDPCTTANFKLGCYVVQGAVAGTTAIVRGAVIYVGTIAYVLVEGTGQLLKFIGSILPGAIGDIFTNVGDGVSAFANNIGQAFRVGPYLGT